MEITGARTHRYIERWYCFQIVIEHIGLGLNDQFKRSILAQEVGRQHLNRGLRATRTNGADRVRKMPCPAVREIIAIERLVRDGSADPKGEGRE